MPDNKNILAPAQVILKGYQREAVGADDIERLRQAMAELLDDIKESETEEYNKNLVIKFLASSLYRSNAYKVNTYGKADLAIYADGKPVVFFEFKGPGRPDMVTPTNLNRKSLHELVLYYLREEMRNGNTGIKHLVITDCIHYFVFEKKNFYQLFAKDKKFVATVLSADAKGGDNTDYIYNQLIAPMVERKADKLRCTYLDLSPFKTRLRKEDIVRSRNFLQAYKLFSPTHLLRLPFANDHNTLNNGFYRELLYIMGVEEVTEDKARKIKRVRTGRQPFSLLEQAYAKLEDYDFADEKECFDAALGLVLVWINRILFLKLLESQLINFTGDHASRFLDTPHVPGYDELHDLFREVLARPVSERNEDVRQRFAHVPYLNSSLFEVSPLEKQYFSVGALRLGDMSVYRSTVLRGGNGRWLTGCLGTLDYLFRFLDAYDFGADTTEDDVRQESKTIISASVLGLIFEKINGYKDGSFFTPGFITEYICDQTLKQTVVDKFNAAKGWQCADFEELKERMDTGSRDFRLEANAIVNSLRVCDPAVGSGHFLVSALNALLAIKSELGILQDHSEKPKRIMDYSLTVENDELVVSNEDGELFHYEPSSPESQRVQQTLFEEKRTIIENCLFGVDLNLKSVEICRLRLWIELLKNAYYYRTADGTRLLQTLPNIDINIKCGDSICSRRAVRVGRKVDSGEGLRKIVGDYKQLVKDYKQCSSKQVKREIQRQIDLIKHRLNPPVQLSFDHKANKKAAAAARVLSHSLEWMLEFPEVLDADGALVGFDAIIGNPPYISLERLHDASAVYADMKQLTEKNAQAKTYLTHQSSGDIYTLFVERGLQLLRQGGRLAYIIPNKWTKVMYGRPLRKLFLERNLYNMVDFGDHQIFADATTYTCIIQMQKAPQTDTIAIATIPVVDASMLKDDAEERKEDYPVKEMDEGIWHDSSLHNFSQLKRLGKDMTTLGEFIGGESFYGIKTGLTDAFLLNQSDHERLSCASPERFRPFLQGRGLQAYGEATAGSHLLFMPKGFTAEGMGINRETQPLPTEQEAWEWFLQHYPLVAEWLAPFEAKAKARQDKGDYWWELRACTYYDRFEESKLFYQVFQTKPCFVYDEASTFCNNSMYFIPVRDKRLLALLNSQVGWWLITEYCPRIQNGHQLIWDNFSQIPIPHELPMELDTLATQIMQAVKTGDTALAEKKKAEVEAIAKTLYV